MKIITETFERASLSGPHSASCSQAQTGTGSASECFRRPGLKLPVCVFVFFAALEDGGYETE